MRFLANKLNLMPTDCILTFLQKYKKRLEMVLCIFWFIFFFITIKLRQSFYTFYGHKLQIQEVKTFDYFLCMSIVSEF